MPKDDRSTAMPRLRFPEFRMRTGWTSIQLGQLADFVMERVGTAGCTPYTVTSGVGLVSQREKYGRTIAGNSIRNYVVLQRNDFAYNKSATKAFPQGYIARYVGAERAAVPSSIFTCFRLDDRAVDPAYLDYLLSSNLHGKWLRNYITIGARAHGSLNVNDDDLMALPVPLPNGSTSLKEQRKIANCLTSLDEVMTAQAQKVEALKDHKRGLMEQLFPCEGQTLPRLRFPEFQDGPEWEPRRLEQLVEIESGGTPSKANPAFWSGTIPWVSAKDMKRLMLEDAEDHISMAAVNNGAKLVPAGTLLMLTRGMTLLKDVPICVLNREMSFNQDVKALRPKGNLKGLFLAILLLGNKLRLLRMVDVASHGTGKLNTDELKALELVVPMPAEQHRISECLSALDGQIAIESQQFDVLKTYKKGLMQQLFPSPEGD